MCDRHAAAVCIGRDKMQDGRPVFHGNLSVLILDAPQSEKDQREPADSHIGADVPDCSGGLISGGGDSGAVEYGRAVSGCLSGGRDRQEKYKARVGNSRPVFGRRGQPRKYLSGGY